jgi:hypothetical protein
VIEERRPHKFKSFRWMQTLAKGIAALGFTPNMISLAGVAFALAGFACLWATGNHPLGLLMLFPAASCVLFRLVCNALDTLVLWQTERPEKGRALFKEVPERVEDLLFLVGSGYAAKAPVLGWVCAILALATAHVRLFGASLGYEEDFSGPFAQPVRMYVLLFALPVAGVAEFFLFKGQEIIYWTLVVIAMGTAYTAARRVARLYQRMRSPASARTSRITLASAKKTPS